ncbi:hypothetical protein LguiA_003673 [Lonicera macranthoides]
MTFIPNPIVRHSRRESQPQQPAESRSPIATALEPLLFVKLGNTRRALNSSFANCLSNALFVKLPRTSRPI